jgi:ABC-2 type transport system ATP-binding protein
MADRTPSDIAILADELRRTFDDVVAVDHISLAVPRGTVLGLLGANGAGKTTMVRMLTTVLEPTAGRGVVNGFDVRQQPQAVRRSIGLAGQYAAVDENLTGRENLSLVGRLNHMSKAATRERATQLLDQFRLTDAADRPVRTYSGGMRRRLDLGAALVTTPPVLFLDEPTTGLDPASRLDLWGVIEELVHDGTTVLLTTQYLEEADELADTVAIIVGGKIATEGSPARLKAALGGESINLLFDSRETAEKALDTLKGTGDRQQLDRDVVRLYMAGAAEAIPAVINQLDQGGIAPLSLTLTQPTLDDVFLQVTGQRLQVQDAPQAKGKGKTQAAQAVEKN